MQRVMGGLLGLGMVVMIVADAAVGLRLIGLAARTHQLPELAIGAAFLLMGGIGYPLTFAARNGLGGPENLQAMLALAFAVQNLGCLAMAVATWRTFRPDDSRALAACGLVGALMAVGWGGQLATGAFSATPGTSWLYWFDYAGRLLPFVWGAVEAWRYHGMLRRRLALGLADPVVTDRFRLWALSASGVTGAFLLFLASTLARVDVAHSLWLTLGIALVSATSGVCFWLAFLPPRFYLRRFEAAGAAGAAAPAGAA